MTLLDYSDDALGSSDEENSIDDSGYGSVTQRVFR
jgi:hypothetical protein